MTLTLKTAVVLGALTVFGLTGLHPVAAQTIYNFDFSAATGNGNAVGQPLYQGQGALGLGGTFFNNGNNGATAFTFSNAKDSNSNASTVTLTLSGTGGTYSQKPSSPSTYVASDPAALFAQYIYSNGATTFTLANLPSNSAYTLYLYGATNYNNGSTFTVGGVTKTTAGGSYSNVSFIASPAANSNYVIYTGTTSATGIITGSVGAGSFADINGLQVELTPAPEPSPSAVLGMGIVILAALGLRARRRGAAAFSVIQ